MDTIKIIIDTNAQDAGKSFDDLSKKFKDTDNSAKDLRKEIRELKNELFTLTPGTEEYSRVLQDLGGKMDQLSETTQELRAATGGLDTVFETTTRATASLASGFTAAAGVVTIFGGDAENLQKTFVKLQAAMAIMTGLKGFAAFPKEAKKAVISLKTFISTTKLATKSTIEQTSATATLSATEGVATVSTNVFKKAWQGLTAAMASNPIGAAIVAISALATAFIGLASAAKKANDEQGKYSLTVNGSVQHFKTYSDYIEAVGKEDERILNLMKTLGAEEDRLNATRLNTAKTRLKEAEQRKEEAEEELAYRRKIVISDDTGRGFWLRITGYIKEAKNELNEATEAVNKFTEELKDLTAVETPQWFDDFNKSLNDLSDKFRVDIAAGTADKGDYIKAQLKAYGDALINLEKRMKEAKPEDMSPDEFLAALTTQEIWKQKIKELNVDLAVYNAELDKKANEAAKKAAETLIKNFKKLSTDISDKADEYQEAWLESLRNFAGMGKYSEKDLLDSNESLGRTITEINRYSMLLDEYAKQWLKDAKKALDAGEITQKQFDRLDAMVKDTTSNMVKSMRDELGVFMTDGFFNAGKKIQDITEKFKKENETMLAALAGGLVSKEEYHSFLIDRFTGYKQEIDKEMPAAMQELEASLQEAVANGMNEETYKKIYEEYLNIAKDIIPPSVMQQISISIKEVIDKEFAVIEDDYTKKMNEFKVDIQKATYSWMYGTYGDNSTLKSGNSLMWRILFGQGNDPKAEYEEARRQAQEMFDILAAEAEEEKNLLLSKMSLLDQSSDQYQAYADKIKDIEASLITAQQELEQKQLQNAEDYADKIYDISSSTFDALGGLASAMGSYYGEQKEQAKELYGENSEEYQKYLKKEGTMKIAEVWANWATGVMAAWAANAKYGVASYILAALQTAALTATAIASTQQINRSTKANSSGGGSTANVSGLTDRVIMGQVQDTDQTAQLNAGYNQGAQRVFVTVDDINNGQDANRTAVTNNQF